MARPRDREFTPELKRQVWIEQRGKCAICGEKCRGHGATRRGQIHHIWPIAFGGSNHRRNAIGLCVQDHEIADRRLFEEGKAIGD